MITNLYYSVNDRIRKKEAQLLSSKFVVRLIAAVALAFVWVGSYQYRYNVEAFNTGGINIWAFSLWVCGGYTFLNIHFRVERWVYRRIWQYLLSWLIYFAGLVAVEYIGYYVLCIRERSAQPGDALVFGLIHGTFYLHIYYLFFPFVILPVHHFLFSFLVRKQQRRPGRFQRVSVNFEKQV